jgi:hypothetical protein
MAETVIRSCEISFDVLVSAARKSKCGDSAAAAAAVRVRGVAILPVRGDACPVAQGFGGGDGALGSGVTRMGASSR